MKAHTLSRLLTAMAISCLAWFLYLSLAPGTPLTDAATITAAMNPAGLMFMTAPIAFMWLGVFWYQGSKPLRHVATMVLLCVGLMLLTLGVHLTYQYLYAYKLPGNYLISQLAGILFGLLTWYFAGQKLLNSLQALSSRLHKQTPVIRLIQVFGILLLLAVPLDGDALMANIRPGWGNGSISGIFVATQQHLYTVIKGVILWIPLGLIFSLAGKDHTLKIWVLAGVGSFALVAAPLFSSLLVRDVMEVAFAPLGIWAGVWVGSQTRMPFPVFRTTASQGTHHVSLANPDPFTVERSLPPFEQPQVLTAGWLGRSAAVLLLIAAALLVWDFPRLEPWLGAGLFVYILVLWKYPSAWLVAVPALLPALNLAPLTGRFFFDEFDILMICTTAMAFWNGASRVRSTVFPPAIIVALTLFGLSYFISLLIGLLPFQPLDANAFTSYWSSYNSLRVAKGGLWALVLLLLVSRFLPCPVSLARQQLTNGMLLGLVGVMAVGLRERWQFAGLFDLETSYRTTASFASMHTGGSHIEAYLVMAIPFLWLFIMRNHRLAIRLAGLVLFLAAVYLTITTIARGGVFALVVGLGLLGIGSYRATVDTRTRSIVLPAVLLLGAGAVLSIGLSGEYFQHRLARIEEDAQTRLAHWSTALAMMEEDLKTQALGMGLGTFPMTYLYQAPEETLPATYTYATETNNMFLRLGSGGTLYMAQRVAVHNQHRYTLSMDLRSRDPKFRLEVPLCEKHLLNSFHCKWQRMPVLAGDNQWHHAEIPIDSGEVGSGSRLSRRPVDLSLYNPASRTIVDIDNVRLIDSSGSNLIRNGDFSEGGDHWFFRTHEHLPWHIKNLWIQLYFEQGWLGLLTFCLLLFPALGKLFIALWKGDMFASTLLASVSGFLAVGLVGSPFDAPRLATLFFMLLLVSTFRGDMVLKDSPHGQSQGGDALNA